MKSLQAHTHSAASVSNKHSIDWLVAPRQPRALGAAGLAFASEQRLQRRRRQHTLNTNKNKKCLSALFALSRSEQIIELETGKAENGSAGRVFTFGRAGMHGK